MSRGVGFCQLSVAEFGGPKLDIAASDKSLWFDIQPMLRLMVDFQPFYLLNATAV